MAAMRSRRQVLRLGAASLIITGVPAVALSGFAAPFVRADLVIYGATAAGVVAAVQARRMGRAAVIVEPGTHLGGLTTGGLGMTDTGVKTAIGGIAGEFYRRVQEKYAGAPATSGRFTFEPHVATEVIDDLLSEHGIAVYSNMRLRRVLKSGTRITGLVMEDGRVFRAPMFIDATYEGDLMDRAGVSWTMGREANSAHGETINGVQLRLLHQFTLPVSPYRVAGNPSSGLLPGINAEVAPDGTGDRRIQAYNFRMCLTQAATRIPFPRPAGYDPSDYELLLRYIQAGATGPFFTTHIVGGAKTDSNNDGAFSTDFIGANYSYPTATYAVRDSIRAEHRRYQQGLIWFLANDSRLPPAIRSTASSWGLAADEFTADDGWPPQLYVREARRMVSDYVMTEHDCRGTRKAPDPIGLASYAMDSHNCQRVVVDGLVKNEGDVQAGVPGPYPVSYRSIVPSKAQCTNLLVPVCLSASHIAYGSIRMEPVFMVLAQSAATAAVIALSGGLAVQDVAYDALAARLGAGGQILRWPPPGLEEAAPGEVIVDSASAAKAGTWLSSSTTPGAYGGYYDHDNNTGKGVNWQRFTPSLPAAGRYHVYLRWTAEPNRASNVPVDIEHGGGVTTRTVDQRTRGGQWVSLGVYTFPATGGSVLIRTEKTNGYVIADAVRFVAA